MCELFAMSFNQPVRPNISFKGFRRRGRQNPDGWGMALYPDKSVQIIKEPLEAGQSPLSEFLIKYEKFRSKIFISHVRRKTVGDVTYMDTHPFNRELNGKEYTFSHNGTLRNYRDFLSLGRFCPVGYTDSEYAFCYILKCIQENYINRWDEENFRWLWGKIKEINKFGNFNCLFSDGEYLFCYYDKNGYNGLCFVHREAPYRQIRLVDEDFEINLAEEKDPIQKGFVIATRCLTDEQWEDFSKGELIVFSNGDIVFSSSGRSIKPFETPVNTKELNILRVIRKNPHRLNLIRICQTLNLSKEEVAPAIHSLLNKGYIKQDSRDSVLWNHNEATFFTEPSKREEIDKLIKNER